MTNYIAITNWSEFPDIKGIVISDGRLIRSFCRCGYVDKTSLSQCPSCGNKDFVKSKKQIKTRRLVLLTCANQFQEKIQLEESSYFFDIARTQCADTKILKKNTTPYRYGVSYIGYDTIRSFFDDPLFLSFPPYVVAKELLEEYDLTQWPEMVRTCLLFNNEDPKRFSKDLMIDQFNQMGENLPKKIRTISGCSSTTSMYNIVKRLNSLSDSMRIACDNPSVFNEVFHMRISDNKSFHSEVVDLVHSYWKAGYISEQSEANILKSIYTIGLDKNSINAFVKFFKEEFASISKQDVSVDDFLTYLKNMDQNTSVKDYFIESNRKIVEKAFKQKEIKHALEDVYQNPASFFITLMKEC